MKKVLLKIDGMTCSACSSGLEKYLNKQDGIKQATVNLIMNNANIEYDDKKLTLEQVEKFVESLPQEEKLGGKIVTRALQEPVRQIAINAGLEPAVILEKVKASPAGVGFDAGKEEYQVLSIRY